MRDADTPSFSAALVASMRGVASRLPATRGIAQDDVSWVWARARLPRLYDAAPRTMRFILWVSGYNRFAADMAVRTRVIDDAVLDIVSAGGKQARARRGERASARGRHAPQSQRFPFVLLARPRTAPGLPLTRCFHPLARAAWRGLRRPRGAPGFPAQRQQR